MQEHGYGRKSLARSDHPNNFEDVPSVSARFVSFLSAYTRVRISTHDYCIDPRIDDLIRGRSEKHLTTSERCIDCSWGPS